MTRNLDKSACLFQVNNNYCFFIYFLIILLDPQWQCCSNTVQHLRLKCILWYIKKEHCL